MENEFRDLEFAAQLCRLDREAELCRSIALEVSDLIVTNCREWLKAADWTPVSSQKANK
ncbi:MAG TPA: hypothetical protein VMF91_24040 [Bryobacteraceae bacterium]|nr:hypothetical protein [Bryobacteraceae bacterium]